MGTFQDQVTPSSFWIVKIKKALHNPRKYPIFSYFIAPVSVLVFQKKKKKKKKIKQKAIKNKNKLCKKTIKNIIL